MGNKYFRRSALAGEKIIISTNFHVLITLPKLFIPMIGTEIITSDKRVFVKTGFIATQIQDIPLQQIEEVRLSRTILGRLFGWGDVAILGTGGDPIILKGISKPLQIYQKTRRAVAML